MKFLTYKEWLKKHQINERSNECVKCEGTGKFLCKHCEGDGNLYTISGEEAGECPECYGNGAEDCDECGGTGNFLKSEYLYILKNDKARIITFANPRFDSYYLHNLNEEFDKAFKSIKEKNGK